MTIGTITTTASNNDGSAANRSFFKSPIQAPTTPKSTSSGKMELALPGSVNGQPVLDISLEALEDKPWRKPGWFMCSLYFSLVLQRFLTKTESAEINYRGSLVKIDNLWPNKLSFGFNLKSNKILSSTRQIKIKKHCFMLIYTWLITLLLTGADISDYFNYGFNEITWSIYCDKQRRLRSGLDAPTIPQNALPSAVSILS